MKNFWRILTYAKPLGSNVPQYAILTLLYVLFNLMVFGSLKPLLDLLFNENEVTKIVEHPGGFSFRIAYIIDLFSHYFSIIITENGRLAALKFVCLIIIVAVFFSNIFRYLASLVLARVRIRVLTNVRNHIFNKVTSLQLDYFSETRKGDIMSRVSVDVMYVEGSVINSITIMLKEPILIIGYFAMLFYMSVEFTLYSIIILPISGVLITYIAKLLRKSALKTQESEGRLQSIMDEILQGMRIVKAFTAEKKIGKVFANEVDVNGKYRYSISKKNDLASPLSEFMGILAIVLLLIIGGTIVIDGEGELTGSQFIQFLLIFAQVLNPAKAISRSITSINRGLASADRIFELIDTKPVIQNVTSPIPISSLSKHVLFENVFFAYQDRDILKNINLEIKKGEVVALVGPSGGGKSTLADLIPRFYDIKQGKLSIDGVAIKDYDIRQLRSLVGVVTQESILFNDTIKNNIGFGLKNVADERVIEAARIANAHDFILQTPQGYDTVIGERGTKLSGGQRQRISIARAILKDPDILILDEATSALDSQSELLVQEALENLMKGRTSIVIAHRLSTIQNADKIIVLKDGKIIQQGNHPELVATEGLYKKLTEIQSF
ncbi:MAG: ABC transporter ATP-binding protein [Cyclobacteriaceae bacterium]